MVADMRKRPNTNKETRETRVVINTAREIILPSRRRSSSVENERKKRKKR